MNRVDKILEKLRAKYPELEEESLMDELEASLPDEGEAESDPMEDDMPMEDSMEEAPGPDDSESADEVEDMEEAPGPDEAEDEEDEEGESMPGIGLIIAAKNKKKPKKG